MGECYAMLCEALGWGYHGACNRAIDMTCGVGWKK